MRALKKKLLTTLAFLLPALLLLGQGEANIWYFGQYAGIDFNSGAPVALTNGQMDTWEGCASIADPSGNLVFYTDGSTVWNSAHAVMSNGTGLMGNFSSTQSAIIVPKPNNPNIYYIFTVDEVAAADGLRYSEVDMTLAGGLGAVTATKNILLHTPVLEKVTAVQHANGTDIWVVSHEYGNNNYLSYLVTTAGVSATPIVSSVGQSIAGGGYTSVGYLKASPDGSYMAAAHSNGTSNVELLDFNNATGQLSNPIIISSASWWAPYGVEFSPNSQVLYMAEWGSNVWQYDLQAGSAAAINASMYQVNTSVGSSFGSIQLGPDGKIYCSRTGATFLSSIDDPDVLGAGCLFVDNSVSLSSGISQYGLPPFVQSFFNASGSAGVNCVGDTTFFTLGNPAADSVLWFFGDSASGVLDTSQLFNPGHLYPAAGNYTATLHVWQAGQVDTTHIPVEIEELPVVNLGIDTMICDGETYVADPGFTNATYLWSDLSTGPTLGITQPGDYWVEVTDSGCTAADTIHIGFLPLPQYSLHNDTFVCPGTVINLSAATSNSSYMWHNGHTGPTMTVDTVALVWVDVTLGSCTKRDTFEMFHLPVPSVNLGPDSSRCEGDTIWLDATTPGASYSWWNGSTGSMVPATQNGSPWVEINVGGCTARDTVEVFFQSPASMDLGPNIYKCDGQSHTLDAPATAGTHTWSDGTSTPQLHITAPGVYWVEVEAGSCLLRDSLTVFYNPNPAVDLGPDSAICEDTSLVLNAGNPGAAYGWIDGTTAQTYTAAEAGWHWVNVTMAGCTARDSMWLEMKPLPSVYLGEDVEVCEGILATFDASYPGATYQWNTGATTASIEAPEQGTYHVRVELDGCFASDAAEVRYKPQPEVELGPDTTICEGTTLMLDASWPDAFVYWNTGLIGETLPVQHRGVYAVRVKLDGCIAHDTIAVQTQELPRISLPPTLQLCEFETALLKPETDFNSVLWWPDNSHGRSFEVREGGLVEVEAKNRCGTALAAVEVEVVQCECELFIPNAFTPNYDGINDGFGVTSDCDFESYEFLIFNRWGELMFRGSSPNDFWDGTNNGQLVPMGTYVWRLSYTTNQLKGKRDNYKTGYVTVVR